MGFHVLITGEIEESGKKLLLEHGCEIVMGFAIDEETVLCEASHCDAILTRNANITERILYGCPNLKVVSMHGVGVNGINVDCAILLGIQVTNAACSNQNSVKEALRRMSYQSALGIVETLEGRYLTYPVNHPNLFVNARVAKKG